MACLQSRLAPGSLIVSRRYLLELEAARLPCRVAAVKERRSLQNWPMTSILVAVEATDLEKRHLEEAIDQRVLQWEHLKVVRHRFLRSH